MKRRKPIRKVSKRRSAQLKEYAKLRRIFLAARPLCEADVAEKGYAYADALNQPDLFRASEEVHHKLGRIGLMLNATEHWMAVSRFYHTFIHEHPSIAREKGWLK